MSTNETANAIRIPIGIKSSPSCIPAFNFSLRTMVQYTGEIFAMFKINEESTACGTKAPEMNAKPRLKPVTAAVNACSLEIRRLIKKLIAKVHHENKYITR